MRWLGICPGSFRILAGLHNGRRNRLETNAKMRKSNKMVARNSFHIKGEAADIRVKGYRTSSLRNAAMQLHLGGVGYYPKSQFIHVDVGEIRVW